MPDHTVAHTTDEFGEDRWFVEDKHADWVAGPFSTREEASEQAQYLNNKNLKDKE